ncbi:MAG: MotA/TolQ/ExbB proton channel family protein [Candidatus Firestonebacteria bacterium]
MRKKVLVIVLSLAVIFLCMQVSTVINAQEKGVESGLGAKQLTLFGFLKGGGPVFLIIVGCSMFTISVIIERFLYFKRLKTLGGEKQFIETILKTQNIKQSIALCDRTSGVVPRVLKVVLDNYDKGVNKEKLEGEIETQVISETIGMEKFLPQLDTMVTLTPLLGLFGTVIGMIKSFNVVAAMGMGKPEMLAGGIAEALINTAGGLAVAIPALFFYNYLSGKKETYLLEIEKGVSKLILQIEKFKRVEQQQPPQPK